jgi:bacteriorhodopsin
MRYGPDRFQVVRCSGELCLTMPQDASQSFFHFSVVVVIVVVVGYVIVWHIPERGDSIIKAIKFTDGVDFDQFYISCT